MSIEYTNIYLEPFLSIKKREMFAEFVNDSTIFIPEFIYEYGNPNFGVQDRCRMYLEYGIEKKSISWYFDAMQRHFYRKRLLLGDVKIAKGKQTNGTHVYDAVYVEVVDPLSGIKSSVSLNGKNYSPSSIELMREEYREAGFLFNEEFLPLFMRTAQTGSILPTNFIKVVVLCYTLPNQGTKILNRIKRSKFDFNLIDFDVDRVIIEETLDYLSDKYLIFERKAITDSVPI
jgi:hypothetical protein